MHVAGKGVNVDAVQRVSQPTRDVLVERSVDGDRNFAGFGVAQSNEYCDCFIDPAKIPEQTIKVRSSL